MLPRRPLPHYYHDLPPVDGSVCSRSARPGAAASTPGRPAGSGGARAAPAVRWWSRHVSVLSRPDGAATQRQRQRQRQIVQRTLVRALLIDSGTDGNRRIHLNDGKRLRYVMQRGSFAGDWEGMGMGRWVMWFAPRVTNFAANAL